MIQIHTILFAGSLALLAGCKQEASSPVMAGSNTAGMQAVIDEAAKDAAEAGALASGDALLKPGQSVQGSIEADVGKGVQAFRSIATRVADDIGAQTDRALDTGKGQRALDDANRKLEKLGVDTRVGKDDVRDIVAGMAGKTFHDSEVRHIGIIQSLQVTLKGTASDGGHLDLGLSLDDKTLALTRASLRCRPKANAMFDFYQGRDKNGVEVTIDRFERNADGSYAIAGSFTARDLPASQMAKKLPTDRLPSASGRFTYDALPLKDMPNSGR